uniref:Major capsid protein n=1 Tax=Microviridae sp. ctLZT1 TaxID=2824992 RepID=A0A8S5UKM5_9VIRU|nr:MAG TPA: Major capsid protein [Microviridae sp. ctLZT1]
MANIFRKKDSYIDRVNRSTFDLSFVNNFTMKFGAITPVCLLPVSFGDSFQINARFNLQLLPTVFPIQTQLYVRLHFVYVRTRTLWEDWMTFFGGDETVTPPWMDVLADGNSPERKAQFNIPDDLQTGTLADYLGVPTTITGTFGKSLDANYSSLDLGAPINLKGLSRGLLIRPNAPSTVTQLQAAIANSKLSTYFSSAAVYPSDGAPATDNSSWFSYIFYSNNYARELKKGSVLYLDFGFNFKVSDYGNKVGIFLFNHDSTILPTSIVAYCSMISGTLYSFTLLEDYDTSEQMAGFIVSFKKEVIVDSPVIQKVVLPNQDTYYVKKGSTSLTYPFGFAEWTKPGAANCPFYASSGMPAIPLSALPFRAYEAYYNAFGRDIRNNPFVIDGKPEYNRYVPSVKGGRDSYKYQLHYANWEPDAYTTALQSPQAGIAPLVGISSLGEATFRDAAGTEYHAQLETAEDGDTVTGFQVKSSNAPADVVRNLIGMATSGISISDFRNVNSLQRFLEIRVRQSPRYKNLVKGLFDVNLDYDELMMPEFLGGISDTIPVYKVTQTTPTEGNPLGSFAGQGSLQSGMRHVIRKYCPEDGYILGVMSVVPAANYSQLLPPHFTRMNLLDWHFPQFNNISYQPMLYKHLCPYQAFAVNPSNINNVFGYQRAYWDLISSFDEVHGEFRDSMRNFVINRVFDKAPELSKDFLLVNPDHVNDVFSMTSENGDKILGSVAFDIAKKTTVPRESIPHIE